MKNTREEIHKSKRLIRLSYDIEPGMPLYPETPRTTVKNVRSIAAGDACNTLMATLSNHAGTHIDGPKHFWNTGRPITGYSLDELIFNNVAIADCPKKAAAAIEIRDLLSLRRSPDADICLLRTNFSAHRTKNGALYSNKNPYLSAEAAMWLRGEFPGLRAVGIDCISISSRADRDEGKKVHKIILKKNGDGRSPILIVEDMFIPRRPGRIARIIVFPIFIKGADSAPCTVAGVLRD